MTTKTGRLHVAGMILTALLCSCLFWTLQASGAQAAPYPRVIAHGGGAIQGESVTNSVEAVEQAIAQGYQYIELDLAFTTDGQVAMIHDWQSSGSYYLGLGQNKAIPFDQYQKCRVLNRFTPLDLSRLAKILQQHPDVRIITDTKEDNVAILTAIQKQQPAIVKQIIPQIYQYEEYEPVKKLGYPQVILTMYKMSNERNGSKVAKFVKEKGVYAVTMSIDLANTGLAKTLQSYGVAVYMHTVNSLPQTVTALNAGAYGIYSDTLLPEEVTYPGWQYYLACSNNSNSQLSIELQHGTLKLNMRTTNKSGRVTYKVEDKTLTEGALNQVLTVPLNGIETGKHTLKAYLYDGNGNQVATKKYLLWKDQSCALLLAPHCGYILDQFSTLGDFSAATAGYSEAVQKLAQKSMFVHIGSSVYYQNGTTGLFRSGETLLPVTSADSKGNIYSPLYDTALVLGASSVKMNGNTKAMDIQFQGKNYQAGISGVTKYYRKNYKKLDVNVQLYRNRAVADGRFYQALTGRPYIQQDGYLIILPKGSNVTDAQRQELLRIAKQLYL